MNDASEEHSSRVTSNCSMIILMTFSSSVMKVASL
jgi:hypothetical protein